MTPPDIAKQADPPISPADEARIRAEERYRWGFQQTLHPKVSKQAQFLSGLWQFANSALFLWILTSVVDEKQRQEQLRADRRRAAEIVNDMKQMATHFWGVTHAKPKNTYVAYSQEYWFFFVAGDRARMPQNTKRSWLSLAFELGALADGRWNEEAHKLEAGADDIWYLIEPFESDPNERQRLSNEADKRNTDEKLASVIKETVTAPVDSILKELWTNQR